MFTPRRRRFITLSVVPPALAAMGLRNGNPFAVDPSQGFSAVNAPHTHHHRKRCSIAYAADHQLLPTNFVDEEELCCTRAEAKRQRLKNVELRFLSELWKSN